MTPNQGRSPGPDDAAADVIRRLRQRHGLSQRQVSEMLGVGLRTLQRWESGDQVPPAYLARALRDLSRELSRDDEGSIANLIDEYAYVRLIARLAHRARTRAAPESPPDPPQRILLAELPSGVHTPCLLHTDDLVELGRAAATLEVGDEVLGSDELLQRLGLPGSATSCRRFGRLGHREALPSRGCSSG